MTPSPLCSTSLTVGYTAVLIAWRSAHQCDRRTNGQTRCHSIHHYHTTHMCSTWQKLINSFYDGRIVVLERCLLTAGINTTGTGKRIACVTLTTSITLQYHPHHQHFIWCRSVLKSERWTSHKAVHSSAALTIEGIQRDTISHLTLNLHSRHGEPIKSNCLLISKNSTN